MLVIEKKEVDGVMYQICNGTYYHVDTPQGAISWLETSRERKQRIRVFYGSDGKCWNDEFDTIGHIGRSCGMIKIPLLIKNSRSYGGGGILDNRIVRIDTKNSAGNIVTVFRDMAVKFDKFISTDIGTVYNETQDTLYAHCKNEDSGKHLAEFMNGTRWSK
jgi:hypothetical protein